jgi:hypothetical protein
MCGEDAAFGRGSNFLVSEFEHDRFFVITPMLCSLVRTGDPRLAGEAAEVLQIQESIAGTPKGEPPAHEREFRHGRDGKLKANEVGVQIPCGAYPQVPQAHSPSSCRRIFTHVKRNIRGVIWLVL